RENAQVGQEVLGIGAAIDLRDVLGGDVWRNHAAAGSTAVSRIEARGGVVETNLVQVVLLDEGHDVLVHRHEDNILSHEVRPHGGGQFLRHVIGGMRGQRNLLQIVVCLGPGRSLADVLHSWHEQCNEDGDDRNHHQQLNEGESTSLHGNVLSEKD